MTLKPNQIRIIYVLFSLMLIAIIILALKDADVSQNAETKDVSSVTSEVELVQENIKNRYWVKDIKSDGDKVIITDTENRTHTYQYADIEFGVYPEKDTIVYELDHKIRIMLGKSFDVKANVR